MKHDTAKLSPSILGAWISIQKMFENKSDPLDLMKTQRKRRKKEGQQTCQNNEARISVIRASQETPVILYKMV